MTRFVLIFGFILLMFSAQNGQAQILKTKLKVTVLDNLGSKIEGATVKLFKNKENFDQLKGEDFSGVTNEKGIVFLSGLEGISYFINVEKGDKNNYGGAEQTPKLIEGKINKANIIISD